MTEPQSVGAVVGENLERLRKRARLTQHETARLFSRRGIPFSRSKIAALEAGERPNPNFADVLLIAHTFNVELSELFEGDGPVAVAEHITLNRPLIRDFIRGIAVVGGSEQWDPKTRRDELFGLSAIRAKGEAWFAAKVQGTEADNTLANRLGVSPKAVVDIAQKLWGRTLTDERDAQLADLGDIDINERQARRGHITRLLSQQVQAELDRRGLIVKPIEPVGPTEEDE
ncbi:helix-turn-helix transcriptional regulator [Saccharothrix stipae]